MSKSIRNTIIALVIFLLIMAVYHLSTQVKLLPINRERMKSLHHIMNNAIILFFLIKEIFSIKRIVYYKWIVSIFATICLYPLLKTLINFAYVFESSIVFIKTINTDIYAISLIFMVIFILAYIKFKIK